MCRRSGSHLGRAAGAPPAWPGAPLASQAPTLVDCLQMTDFPEVAARGLPAAGAIASAPALPVIVLAERPLDTPDHIVEHFNGRATIRREDISSPEKMRKATAAADAVVVALDRLTGDLIEAMDERVRVIGRMGVGTDTVNLDAAAAQGITVFNEPTVNVHEVAGHTMAMLLALQRKLVPSDRYVRARWRGGLALGPMKPLDEVVVGVIRCGRVGPAVLAPPGPLLSPLPGYHPAAREGPPP